MRNRIYRKEIALTAIFTVLLIICGHSAQLFLLFPSLQQSFIWGFPAHYIVPILAGWLGLLAVTVIMALVLNRFDDEIEEYTRCAEEQGSRNS